MTQNPKWINNQQADQIVSRIQQAVANNKPDQEAVQIMMDMVSGVHKYSVSNTSRQGVIKRLFEKECRRHYSQNNDYSNFSINLDDVISIFWEAIIKDLPDAKVFGTVVSTRAVKGQSDNGTKEIRRQTNANPINWLKMRGVMAVRNAMNKIYNRNLIQICSDCGNKSRADSRETNGSNCPDCKSKRTIEHWPDGNSTYKATKHRKCLECSAVWKRKFSYVCGACLSINVHIESKFENKEDVIYDIASDVKDADEVIIDQELEVEMQSVISGVYVNLPLNPDPNASPTDTKARAILDVIFDPIISKDICTKCVLKADIICSEKCTAYSKTNACEHAKIKNPRQTCGAEYFSLEKCVNYSKKIGEYHGVSATLSSRRIQTIRKYFVKYVCDNRHIDLCDSLYSLLKKRGHLNVY